MNAPLRKISIAVLVLFALLFVNLNYVQVVEAGKLRSNPQNQRVLLQSYERQRGDIVVDGKAIATSTATNDKLKYLRSYPGGAQYAPVTGFYSLIYGSSQLERAEDPVLSGDDDRLFVRRLSDLVTGRTPRGGNVVLTLSSAVQSTAWQQMQGKRGAVVAMDPRTGAILAMVSTPSYNPNPLSSHDTATIRQAWSKDVNDSDQPLLNRAINDVAPPGSTFKIVVSAAALENGYTKDSVIPAPTTYTPPGTSRAIPNYDGETCPGGGKSSLIEALTVSCNTAYAGLGVKLGADKIRPAADQFGIGDDDLTIPMRVSGSSLGSIPDTPALAQTSIGQRDVKLSPLQDCMLAATVANDGKLMKPYLVKELQSPNLTTLQSTSPQVYRDSMSSSVAQQLQAMMESVVKNGTGKNAQLSGYTVGGKTGTAQNGGPDHGWFTGFAGKQGQTPSIAVSVWIQNAGTGGSAEATSIAGKVMQTALSQAGSGG